MKHLVLAIGIILASTFGVKAQQASQGSLSEQTYKVVKTLTDVCGLNQEQINKVTVYAQSFVETRAANKQKYASDPAGLKAANKTNKENLLSQVNTVLTPEQQAKLKQYLADQKAKNKTAIGE